MHVPRILLLAALAGPLTERTLAAQVIFSNSITGTNPNTSNPYTSGQVADLNLTVSGIGRGTGVNGASANDRFNASGWNSSSLDTNDYFTWTLTPVSGSQLTVLSFAYAGQASASGPGSFAVRASTDAFSTDLGTPSAAGTTVTLSSPSFQALTSAVEFRLYGWNASAAGGTFSINDFTFTGSLSAVPEPATSAMIAGLLALGLVVTVRRRAGRRRAAIADARSE